MNSLNREQQNKTERWEKTFRIKFGTFYIDGGNGKSFNELDIKKFIKRLLSDARREERERCLKALPKKKKTSILAQVELVQRPEWNKKYNLMELRYLVKGYNQALTTAEENIKKLDQISQSIKEK